MTNASTRDPVVTVGIVTWNSEQDLPACLEGLAAQAYPALELIVVDNGSADGSVELVRRRFPKAAVLRNPANEGHCRAQNQAISASHGDYYLSLNPDVCLLPGYIQRMVEALRTRPDFGSAAGKLWQMKPGSAQFIDSTGLFIDRSRHQYLRGHGQPDRAQFDTAGEVFGVDGAVAFHRRKMLEDVAFEGEYFDEQFFAYMDDVDLAWRARLRGWRAWYDPAAQAYHRRRFKPGRRLGMERDIRRIAVKNRYLTILKNEGPEEWRRDWWRVRLYDLQVLVYMLFIEQSSLGAYGLLRREWARGKEWREEIWRRARARPEERLRWFG
jgi:GT2 family glycosyltransferase